MKLSKNLVSIRTPLMLLGATVVLLSSALTARSLETDNFDVPVTPPTSLGCVIRPVQVVTPSANWCPEATAYPRVSPTPVATDSARKRK